MKLQQKLMLLSTLSKALMAVVLLLALPWVVERLVLRHTDHQLRAELRQVQARIEYVGIAEFLPQPQAWQRTHYDLLQDEYIELRLTDDAPAAPAAATTLPDTIGTFQRARQGQAVDFRVLRHAGTYRGQAYTCEIGKSVASIEQVHDLLQTVAAYALLLLVATTLLIEVGVIRYLLRPIGYIIARLQAVKGPTLSALPPLTTGATDFRYLDAALEQMLHKSKAVFERERQLIADTSHELLTPISILQNRFENMLRAENLPEAAEAQLVTSQKTLERMTATLRTLLLISRVENNQFARTERVLLAAVVADVLAELEDRIAESGLTVQEALIGTPVLAPANPTLIFTVLFNLLANAIKYNEVGGWIAIEGQPQPGGGYTLQIRNGGMGIAAANLPHVFERFRRFHDADREGYGLGLAVVSSIAQLHGIGVTVTSDAQRGTVFRLALPAPPPGQGG